MRDLSNELWARQADAAIVVYPHYFSLPNPAFPSRKPRPLSSLSIPICRTTNCARDWAGIVRGRVSDQQVDDLMFLFEVFNTDRDWSVPGVLTAPGLVRYRAEPGPAYGKKPALPREQFMRLESMGARYAPVTGRPAARKGTGPNRAVVHRPMDGEGRQLLGSP